MEEIRLFFWEAVGILLEIQYSFYSSLDSFSSDIFDIPWLTLWHLPGWYVIPCYPETVNLESCKVALGGCTDCPGGYSKVPPKLQGQCGQRGAGKSQQGPQGPVLA